MKRMLGTLGILLLLFNGYAEKRYVIKRITDEGSNYFDMNKLGEVAYVGVDGQGHQQVYFYTGGVTYQLTETPAYSYNYYSIDINDKGHIVWSMSSNENSSATKYIIMYYNGAVSKLVDNLYNSGNFELNVKINNSDVVVWQQVPYYGAKMQCYKFDGKIHNLGGGTNNPNMNPVINDNGLIAWYGDNRWENDWDYRIRYTSPGDTVVKIISQAVYQGSSSPAVDNLNNIFFNRYDNGYYDLYRFNGTETFKIADSIYQSYYAVNNGNIVYTKGTQNNYTVYRFSPEGILSLANGGDYYYPAVNSSGISVWRNSNNEIFTNRDGGSKKIGEDCHKPPKINDDGTIVFAGFDLDNYGSAIYVAEYKEVFDFSGRVALNSQGGAGLDGVEIIANDKVLATTDANGNFVCSSLDPGTYTFTFSKSGYRFLPASVEVGLNAHYVLPQDIIASVNSGLKDFNNGIDLVLYPNPANVELHVRMSNIIHSPSKITITDLAGRTVKSVNTLNLLEGNEIKIGLDGIKSGLYYFILDCKDRQVIKTFSVL